MKISELIEILEERLNEHGDIDVFLGCSSMEYETTKASFVKAGSSLTQHGTGPHQFQPDRLIVSGKPADNY